MTELPLSEQEKTVRKHLIKLAHNAKKNDSYVYISYQKLCDACRPPRLNMQNKADVLKIGEILDNISKYEHRNGRPILSSLVVNKSSMQPGDGFYELCKELFPKSGDLEKQREERVDFGMVKECIEYWKNEENHTKYKDIE